MYIQISKGPTVLDTVIALDGSTISSYDSVISRHSIVSGRLKIILGKYTASGMAYFHYRCGERITLLNDNCTAARNDSDFDHGLVISAEPLMNDVLFEIKIDRKVNSWSGSIEIGVTECDPLHFDFPPCASKIQYGSWIMTGNSIVKDGSLIIERYGTDLDKLNQDDRIGLTRTSEGDLIFYINGESQGVAAEGLPPIVYAVVDLYGKCVQITITSPLLREHNNDDCLSGSSVLAIENDILNVTLGGDLSELSLSSSNSLDIRMDMNISLPEESPRDKLHFHERCGSLVKLTNGQRTAERRRPLDEFNNGVVMTHRPLCDNELFEIRIDRLVDKWSGSIEMGITTHNPSTLVFPATMTNMRSGTIMMSGCGILTNGKGTRREYGNFNLDELSEGDRVGMIKKSDGSLHYIINGLDQGVAAQHVPNTVWGVIDLYGMTIKVSIVERDEREEQNLMTRRNTRDQHVGVVDSQPPTDYYDRLTFHPTCGTHAEVINNGRTAHRPNAADDFNNGVVLTCRPLKTGELFEVRLDRVVIKWAGSIEIGVTVHNPTDLEFPFTMTNVRSGTWMMTGSGIMHNGTTVLEKYGVNLDRLQVGDRVGVVRKENGLLHFFVNGVDQGTAASNVPERIYGVIDLYGQAVEATIVDMFDYESPDTVRSSLSNTTLYSDLRFHHVHGRNARIINNGQTALRPRPLAEFNDAIVFSNRPLRDGELFEICLDNMVDRWSGSIELGVTAVRPDDIELPSTATDLGQGTWMLSGSSVMENGTTIKNNYTCNLDSLGAGVRLGVMRSTDKTLEFYKDGIPQGVACLVPNNNIYAVVDLYGQCAQVSIPCASPVVPFVSNPMERSDTSVSLQAIVALHANCENDLHHFSEFKSKGVTLSDGGQVAVRGRDIQNCIVYSSSPLIVDELYEIAILSLMPHLSGTLSVGVTETIPTSGNNTLPLDCCYITGNELHVKNKVVQHFAPSLNWLRCGDRIGLLRTKDEGLKIFINGEELSLNFPNLLEIVYVVVELKGSCTGVAVTSRKTSPSPLTSAGLQDSLDLRLSIEQDMLKIEKKEKSDSVAVPVVTYSFHENRGRNIEIMEGVIARRVASYNQGLVIVQPSLSLNCLITVEIEKVDLKWQSSLVVGLVSGNADRLNLPVTALSLKGSCCIITSDWISINGFKSQCNYGHKLLNLDVGSKVGICLIDYEHLQLYIDDVAEDTLPCSFQAGHSIYAIFDLYGQCQQIKLLNKIVGGESSVTLSDYEKADLEVCEKEECIANADPDVSLSLANEVPDTFNIPSQITPLSPLKECSYKQECTRVKNMLLLPDDFFMSDEPVCYCNYCYKINILKTQDVGSFKDESVLGWVRFPLRNFTNMQTDKWHIGFYGTKMGAVRYILDKGQPLTKGQAQWCNFARQKSDDLQIVFYPSLQFCATTGFKLENGTEVHVAFQLLVKPDAYSISRDSNEWTTKESGAFVLHSLLFQLHI